MADELQVINERKVKAMPLQKLVEQEAANRAILTKYISEYMKEGVDYGKIHINSKCENKYSPQDCRISGHFSKDCLFKPGSEKFNSLMKLTPKFKKDTETWEMAGSKAGLICYVCELTNPKGVVVGEGRGAADINEKNWSMNNTVKIAQKRAQIDAVLRTGGLSDFFTQDLEDMPIQTDAQQTKATQGESQVIQTISIKQIYFLKELLKKKGFTEQQVYEKYKVRDLGSLPKATGSSIITNLISLPDKQEPEISPEEQIDIDAIDEALEKAAAL